MAKLRQVILHPVQGLQPESDNFQLLRSQKWTHRTQHLWSPPGDPHAGSPMLACGAEVRWDFHHHMTMTIRRREEDNRTIRVYDMAMPMNQ